MTEHNRISTWISGFLIGGAIGIGAALLSAPQSGEETRDMLREKSMQLKEQALSTYEDQRSRAENMINDVSSQVKDRTSKLKDVGQDILEDQRSVLERGAKRAKQVIKDETNRTMEEQEQVIDDAARGIDDALNS